MFIGLSQPLFNLVWNAALALQLKELLDQSVKGCTETVTAGFNLNQCSGLLDQDQSFTIN
jgi:hypothetical protein